MDAAALQYENHKLVQQLEAQKSEMRTLEGKFKELRDEQYVIVALENHNDYLKEVVDNARQAISIINEKHERYLDEIEAFKSNHSRELHEIKCLSGIGCHKIWKEMIKDTNVDRPLPTLLATVQMHIEFWRARGKHGRA
ncbi:hypothetical protein E2562_010679 [Oryza meyeriana var. granulata]|uniref:E3 ubiquitin protein ligase n=1 Tax=Oryza meyeriana var. granulata TaxID=110450 RepID=A0A6G1EVY9_9ORYZ|nr:hypothetical protein E2562_010679 [Oryza meyeriana var. granulata]